MADRRKLMAGILNLPESARKDLAQRAQDVEREGVVGMLRKATGEMYNNPIVNTAIGFTPGVGDVQAAGETFAALQRGAPWQETAGYAVGMLPFVPALRTTWHGSPHGFTKFDMSKIGTGEGAQAYGHGLYLAESPDVAGSYRTAGDMGWFEREADKALYSQDIDKAIASTKAELERVSKEPRYVDAKNNLTGVLNVLEARKAGANEYGYLYKVDLPDEQIAKMLDWDKPLSQQAPEVQQAFRNTDFYKQAQDYYGQNPKQWYLDPEQKTGESLYQYMQSGIGDEVGGGMTPAQASAYLQQAGIPGIQYLDQASRGAGEGTRNYVVFSDEIPQILERNGQPIAQALRDYRGAHTAPGPEFGAQLHDVTGGGAMYPEDIYSSRGASIYGHGGSDVAMDKETMRIIQQMRNKPEEMVDIYRAVPNEADISTINPGDWVTINPNYAKQHGESNLPEGYKILQQKVPAKSVWTNADSIHEYGYWPE